MSLLRRLAIEVSSVYLVMACMVTVQGAPLDPNAFTSVGTLDVSAGTLTINTDTLAISGAAAFTGVVHVQGSGLPDIAVFTFDDLTIANGVTITFQGSRPIAILSKGNATINAAIDAQGSGGVSGGPSPTSGNGGVGKLGGGNGGGKNGPTTGKGGGGYLLAGSGGGFGGTGGLGGRNIAQANLPGPGGLSYGNTFTALEGGSGGGQRTAASGSGGGGAGGGGIEICAVGNLTLGQGVNARGGFGAPSGGGSDNYGGGGGSGGGIILHGETIFTGGILNASAGGGGAGAAGGGGGGGGRILIAPSVFTLGTETGFNINVSPGSGNWSPGQNMVDGLPGTTGTVHIAPGWTVVPAGEFLLVGDGGNAVLSPVTGLIASHRRIETDGIVLASTAIASGHDLDLQGGYVSANLGWTMSGTAQISGFGQLSGAVTGGATNQVAASGGALTLGDANNNAGFSFAGTVDIASGATLNLLDADAAELGAVTTLADGGRLNSLNGVELGAGETLTASAAAEIGGKFTNQGTVNGPTAADQFLTFTDDVDGAGSYTGNVLFSDGFSLGNGPAAVSLENLAFDSSAELRIELGGLLGGTEHDQLNVAGTASLDGTLQIQLINDFNPTVGDSFDILSYGSHTGAFDSIVGQPSATLTGLFWTVEYTTTQVILSTSAIPGDLDLDGDVDLDDYAPFSDCLGGPGVPYGPTECENIDLNADGSVDLRDFAVFQAALAVS